MTKIRSINSNQVNIAQNAEVGVSASSGYYRQEADAYITISQRLSVKSGSTYYIKIRGYNGDGEGMWS